ncbi:MAG: TonB-dependent receptor [Bacteroidia bacterium]
MLKYSNIFFSICRCFSKKVRNSLKSSELFRLFYAVNNDHSNSFPSLHFSKFFFWICLLPLLVGKIQAQTCNLHLQGVILDKGTNQPLPDASIAIEELRIGTMTDSLGRFEFTQLCPNSYHLWINHINCGTETYFIRFQQDTSLSLYLNHYKELVDEVVIHGKKEGTPTQPSTTISKDEIVMQGNKNFADILGNIQGVSVLKTGSGVSKPVIHGLYGNRISILNNGIAQSGQQWGNDHAPEIDAFVANHISVIKGASALAYNGNSLGGIVLVEPDKIEEEPHFHGNSTYIFQSNGLGHTLNAQVEQFQKKLAWRVTGTAKINGDRRSATYYLTNTGNKEGNFALQLEKNIAQKWNSSLYYSLFSAEIGVLRGSHIGNVTDLTQAIGKAEPFFTRDTFSYRINAPKQNVFHHLLKLETQYSLSDLKKLSFKYGGQLNQRKEFDVRRSGRSEIPALSLFQMTHFGEGIYQQLFENGGLFKTGLQYQLTDNTNNPETGILPLIPDYYGHQTSLFSIYQRNNRSNRLFYEMGARYDLKNFQVAAISKTLPRVIERYNLWYHNYSLSSGAKYSFSEAIKGNLSLGYTMRSPEVNELFSNGLHQGVSGIEEGDIQLQPEKSWKGIVSFDGNVKKKLFVQALAYTQYVRDFIYLQPQAELRLTIRGAFPVFLYKQTDAMLYGTDWLLSYEPKDYLRIVFKYAQVRGINLSEKVPLVYIPPANLSTSLTYAFHDYKYFQNNGLTLQGRYVFEQKNLLPSQDFLAPPKSYFLLNANFTSQMKVGKNKLKLGLGIDNLLNQKYRDYLNRQRYFADEMGINVSVKVNYEF